MRTAAIKRPCTFGKTAGIHEFNTSVFMSLVIRPLRNITASEPLTRRRPREERSITPAPRSRTAEYSVDGIGWLTIRQFTPRCLTRSLPRALSYPRLSVAGLLKLRLRLNSEAQPRNKRNAGRKAKPFRTSGGGAALTDLTFPPAELPVRQFHNPSIALFRPGW